MHELTETAHGTPTDLGQIRTHKSRCVPAVPAGRPASSVGLTSREQTHRETHTYSIATEHVMLVLCTRSRSLARSLPVFVSIIHVLNCDRCQQRLEAGC